MTEQKIPEQDIVDDALIELVDEVVGDGASEDEFDAGTDVVFEVVEDLVNGGVIEEIPDNAASDEEKKEWIEKSVPVVRAALESALGDPLVSDGEDEEHGNDTDPSL